MAATTAEPKTKKPPKLFSVTGNTGGITTTLSEYATKKLVAAGEVLAMLAKAPHQFPTAADLVDDLEAFISDPTAPKPKP